MLLNANNEKGGKGEGEGQGGHGTMGQGGVSGGA